MISTGQDCNAIETEVIIDGAQAVSLNEASISSETLATTFCVLTLSTKDLTMSIVRISPRFIVIDLD